MVRQHMAVILDIIEYGLEGDREKVREYTQLLMENIQSDSLLTEEQRAMDVGNLHRALERGGRNRSSAVIHMCESERQA